MSKRIYQDDWNLNDVLEVLESGKNPLLKVGASELYLSELAIVRINQLGSFLHQTETIPQNAMRILFLIKEKYLNDVSRSFRETNLSKTHSKVLELVGGQNE